MTTLAGRKNWALLATLLLTSCGGEGADPAPPVIVPPSAPTPAPSPTPAPPSSSAERDISPKTVDPTLMTFLSPYVVINPSPTAAIRNRLFVMLPGTGNVPNNYRLIVRQGAARGYHAIGLSYPNDRTVAGICSDSVDADCPAKVRREIITGRDESPEIRIDESDSISGRLGALLRYLAREAPSEGWDTFLVGGMPDWSKIGIGGSSQGSGHAAMMSKIYRLDRVSMFAGPVDVVPGTEQLSPWLGNPGLTPVDRIFGFIHVDDKTVTLEAALASWEAMRLNAFGDPIMLDGLSPYQGGSHQLLTDVPPADNPGASTHSAPANDRSTPLLPSGQAQFASIWDYMAFP